jgi:glycosyltransferase involved in cell wall biosynthesis/putative flippase GtrA
VGLVAVVEISGTAVAGEREGPTDPEPKRWSVGEMATVDVVVPVHNEERALPGCVRFLRCFLEDQFPFEWTITVVDNASTDGVLQVATELAESDDRIRVLHLDHKGKGHALRTAWQYSDADVVVYMDVDLSTSLDALLPLVVPLVNGHSDIAIGSRLAPGARTVRSGRREVISRCYNGMIRLTHGTRFSDAQCGFKAARTDVVRPLLAHVQDDGWFFDTELLLLAEHNGLRVHEVPVDWVEDVDSRVRIVATAVGNIRGLVRVARDKVTGAARVADLPRRPAPRSTHPDAVLAAREGGLLWQLAAFGLIGLASTAATAVLYALLRSWSPPLMANLVALVMVSVLNTEANRRLTFARAGVPRHRAHLQCLVVIVLYYALTSGALLMLPVLVARPSRKLEVAVLLAASVLGTAGRFLLFRAWVFTDRTPQLTDKADAV